MTAHVATQNIATASLSAELSRDIVVAFLSNPNTNATTSDVTELLNDVSNAISRMLNNGTIETAHAMLSEALAKDAPVVQPEIHEPTIHDKFSDIGRNPTVSVKDSIQDDYLVCLIDGKKLKMIKRHLRAKYGMTFDEYRQFFGLGNDYPSVAPGYAKEKSAVAKAQGLGSTITKTPRKNRKAPEKI